MNSELKKTDLTCEITCSSDQSALVWTIQFLDVPIK